MDTQQQDGFPFKSLALQLAMNGDTPLSQALSVMVCQEIDGYIILLNTRNINKKAGLAMSTFQN